MTRKIVLLGRKERETRNGLRSKLLVNGTLYWTVYSFAHGGPDGGYQGYTVRIDGELVDVITKSNVPAHLAAPKGSEVTA